MTAFFVFLIIIQYLPVINNRFQNFFTGFYALSNNCKHLKPDFGIRRNSCNGLCINFSKIDTLDCFQLFRFTSLSLRAFVRIRHYYDFKHTIPSGIPYTYLNQKLFSMQNVYLTIFKQIKFYAPHKAVFLNLK